MASKALKTSNEPVDRLSSLPDGVLAHILSFIPTKFAATTSVLSKRWRFLYHSIPHIDLDENWQIYPSDERTRYRLQFKEFVNRLLFSADSTHIQSLRLRCKIPRGHEPITSWILAALRRHVEELDLLVSLKGYEKLPTEIFNCKTLRVLRLHGNFIFNVPSSVNMVNLVDLHLEHAEFVDDGCFKKGFPVLKRLRLCHCRMTGNGSSTKALELVSQSLTDFILLTDFDNYKIALHTPNLECLDYSASKPGYLLVMQKLTRLRKAEVDFEALFQNGQKLVYGQYVKKFIKEIQNVKSLRLSGSCLEVLCYSTCPLPTFHNLTTMELGVNHTVGWRPLAKLLENSPNLEVLNFEQGFLDRSSNKLEIENSLGGLVPIYSLEHLREVKIGDFCGIESEFEMVKYLLWKGTALEEIEICSQTFWGWPTSFCQRLLGFKRCSKNCKIVVCWMADENLCKRCLN